MKYRVGGPLIDALMAELGMSGGSVGGLLSGAAPVTPIPNQSIAEKSDEGVRRTRSSSTNGNASRV